MSESNLIVGIDSQTLVWGIRKVGTKEQLQRAQWLFEHLEAQHAQVILPAICLSEYLCPIDVDDHGAVIAALSDRFLIMPFDVLCTSVAADLFNKGNAGRPKGKPEARKLIRSDSLIIATAFRHGARVFYSGDKDCRSMAKNLKPWAVFDLPDQPLDLFGYNDAPADAGEA